MKEIVFLNFRDLNYPGGTPIRINGLIRNMPKDIKIYLLSAFDVPEDIRQKVVFVKIPNIYRIDKTIFYKFAFYTAFRSIRPVLKLFILSNKNVKKLLDILSSHKNKQIMLYQNGSESLSFLNDLGYKTIFDIHGIVENDMISHSDYSLKKTIAFRMEKNRFEDTNKIISISKEMQMYLFEKYPNIDKNKFYISYDGFDITYLKNSDRTSDVLLMKKLNIKEEDETILFAGTLKYSGGVFELLEAIKIYKETYNQNVKLFLIINPNGELINEFKSKVKELNFTKNIHIIGIVPKDKLIDYQRVMKVLVCPDVDAPYNHMCPHIKYFDCLSSKTPTINGKFECLENLGFNESNSFLYTPAGEPEKIASSLSTIFKNYNNAKDIAGKGYDKMMNSHTYQNSSLIFSRILNDR